MREHITIDGQIIASVKHWRPPSWLHALPKGLRESDRFLRMIRNLGSYGKEEILGQPDVVDLLTNAGRDWMHAMVYTHTAATDATFGANVLALSTDTAAPNATDTALAGETTIASLLRKVAGTITHGANASTTSLVASWTAAASLAGIVKAAAVNATSTTTYTLVHEGTVVTATLQINDIYTLTVNTTLG